MWRLAVITFLTVMGRNLWPYLKPVLDKYKWAGAILFIFTFLVLLFSLFLSGCASLVAHNLSSSTRYQKDLKIEVKAYTDAEHGYGPVHTVEGMGVVPSGNWYKVKVFPPETADLISLTSCHREIKSFSPTKKRRWDKFYEFTIEVVPGIETNRICDFQIGLYEKKGQHAWATIVIDSGIRKMPALVKCNGKITQYQGTSACQAKEGLIESIEFDRKVIPTKVVGCTIKESPDGKRWEYLMNAGECTIIFFDALDERISHKHVTYGYEIIVLREFE